MLQDDYLAFPYYHFNSNFPRLRHRHRHRHPIIGTVDRKNIKDADDFDQEEEEGQFNDAVEDESDDEVMEEDVGEKDNDDEIIITRAQPEIIMSNYFFSNINVNNNNDDDIDSDNDIEI
jgi:hypothetical protein